MTESEAGPDEPAATADAEPGTPTAETAPAPSPSPRARRTPWLLVLATFVVSLGFYWRDGVVGWRLIGFELIGALVAFGGLAIALGRLPAEGPRALLRPARREWFERAIFVGFASQWATGLCHAIVAVAMRQFDGSMASSAGSWHTVKPDFTSDGASSFMSQVITAPLCEEPLMRGVLLLALVQRLPRWWAVSITAAIFAVAHDAISPQFLTGLAYGWLTLESGSLWPAVVAHALGNSVPKFTTVDGVRVGELLTRLPPVPGALLALATVALVLLLIRQTLHWAMGRSRPRHAGRVMLIASIAAFAWGMWGGVATGSPEPGEGVSTYVRSNWVHVSSASPGKALYLEGDLVPLTIEPGDTVECSALVHESGPSAADSALAAIRVRAMLAGRSATIELQRERHVVVRPLGARLFRVVRWLTEGDEGALLLGAPGRVVYGPERRTGPLRVVEARMREVPMVAGDRADAFVWVPLGTTCWQVTVAVGDSTRVLEVLRALDERVARARTAVEGYSGPVEPVERSVLLSDLGRLPVETRWVASRLPWLLLGALTCLVLGWVSVRERRSPSNG